MSQPTRGDVHVDRPLTNISVAFVQAQNRYLAMAVFPMIPVAKQSDLYFEYPRGQWFRDEAKQRGPGTESAGSGYEVVTKSYFANKFAFHKDVDDDTRANADEQIDMDRDATEFVTQKLLLRKEVKFGTEQFKTGLWTGSVGGGDITPTTLWDAVGSDPVDDIETQTESMIEKTSFGPNMLVLGSLTFKGLKNNASILDRIKHTERGVLTEEILAALFGVDRVIVARATQNTGAQRAGDPDSQLTMATIFDKKSALLMFVEPNPGPLKPSAGYTFVWTGLFGAGRTGNRMKNIRMEKLNSDRIEGEEAYDIKTVATDLGVFFDAAVS